MLKKTYEVGSKQKVIQAIQTNSKFYNPRLCGAVWSKSYTVSNGTKNYTSKLLPRNSLFERINSLMALEGTLVIAIPKLPRLVFQMIY